MSRHKELKISTITEEGPKTDTKTDGTNVVKATNEDITLEKVVREMANVFYDLKDGITLINSIPRKESAFNIENELEKIYKEQEDINNKIKQEEAKKQTESRPSSRKQRKRDSINSITSNKQLKDNKGLIGQQSNRSKPNTPRGRPTSPNRPSSAPIQSKPIVTNLKFPAEINKQNINAQIISMKGARPSSGPQYSGGPYLRKPSQSASARRSVSIPPPREIYNPLGILKDEVERAIRDKKTFTIKGQFPAVRRSLLKRGWVEKYHPNYRDRLNDDLKRYHQLDVTELVDLLRNRDLAETVKKMIKSKLLRDEQVDLYWDHTFDVFKECPDTKKLTLINRFRRESFSYTSKQGLCQAAREAHWLQIPGVARINHPRCYVLMKGGDTKSFLKDFGLTAAISLLKWVVKNNITGECKVASETGKIPMRFFDFAIAECYKYIKKEKHQDIDEEIPDALEIEWNEFLDQYYKAVHIGNHFKIADKTMRAAKEAKDMVRKANYLLNQLKEHMPYLNMDGYMNIWILKPTNSSRGIGIHICRTLQYILDTIKKNPNTRYVIQKYIERPLLIHDTKFDIRQWFLVSSSYPLTIWIYKLCYLRFSSQTYNLRQLHESIHLTNNSVQAKYLQYKARDPLLTSYGMWNSDQFRNYLSDIGYPTIFETVIYPGMKQCITGAMIAHRDKIDKRKNCFELYGADFILSENFEPWMLEINSNPALHASTPVTAKLCPDVLEDVIKVVVDNARNPLTGTGNFELIYKEKLEAHFANTNQKLEVTGTPLPEDYFCDIGANESATKSTTILPKRFEIPDPGKHLIQTGETMKEALKNLLEIVKREKLKRRSRREKSTEAKSGIEDSNQTNSDLVSLFQSTAISKTSSDHSEALCEIDSNEKMSQDESREVTEMLGEIKSLHFKKQVLCSLINVVDSLKRARTKNLCNK